MSKISNAFIDMVHPFKHMCAGENNTEFDKKKHETSE
jgi:hypothetical protein